MNSSAHLAAMELLVDAMSAPYAPTQKQAGWKRDQYLRASLPMRLKIIGDVVDLAPDYGGDSPVSRLSRLST